ncbi:hypothetical protein RFI_19929, partial [Reticulomyxa filosa]
TTTRSRKHPFRLLVALDSNLNASGEIFVDDGEAQDSVGQGKYVLAWFKVMCNSIADITGFVCSIQSNVTHRGYYGIPNDTIVSVDIYGFGNKYFIPGVDLTQTEMTIEAIGDNETLADFQFDPYNGVLHISFLAASSALSITNDFYYAWTMEIPGSGFPVKHSHQSDTG